MIHYKACLEQYNWLVDIYVIQCKHDLKYLDCIANKYNLPNKIYDKLTNRLTNYINSGFIYNCDKTNHSIIFVANMCKADYYGSSITDEKHFALYIKDTIDDEDAGDGTTMRRWYATMVANGVMVDWEEFI